MKETGRERQIQRERKKNVKIARIFLYFDREEYIFGAQKSLFVL
jgi:hypothetical protein